MMMFLLNESERLEEALHSTSLVDICLYILYQKRGCNLPRGVQYNPHEILSLPLFTPRAPFAVT